MREEFSCWLSEPLIGVRSFRRILCIESGWRGTPPEIADDLFRAIAPCSISLFPNRSIAMPLIGAGDQGYPAEQILESVLHAAASWFRRGLPINVLKIVAYSGEIAALAKKRFLEFKRADTSEGNREAQSPGSDRGEPATGEPAPSGCDIFVSYAHEDSGAAQCVHESLQHFSPCSRVFFDKKTIAPGGSWLMQIADSLDSARRVVALYTPDYWASKYCKDEFCAAYVRQVDTGQSILFPIHFRRTRIPYLFRTVEYADCTEADLSKVSFACREICAGLSRPAGQQRRRGEP